MRLHKMMIMKLLRVHQWYKNLLIFLPIIFSGNLFNLDFLEVTALGFIALCLISSSQYIINDIKDIKRDRKHPEKRLRPIAAGKIKIFPALLLTIVLLGAGLLISYRLNVLFGEAVTLLVIISLLYTFWLKNEIIADVLAISINFVLRAISGAFLIKVEISPWLILGVFFLAWFLVIGKRHAEVIFLRRKADKIRKTLAGYTKELTYALMLIATTLLVMCYALYSFFSQHTGLLITIPFALYTIFRYFMLVVRGDKIARHPERAVMDGKLFLSALLWALITFVIIYRDALLSFV